MRQCGTFGLIASSLAAALLGGCSRAPEQPTSQVSQPRPAASAQPIVSLTPVERERWNADFTTLAGCAPSDLVPLIGLAGGPVKLHAAPTGFARITLIRASRGTAELTRRLSALADLRLAGTWTIFLTELGIDGRAIPGLWQIAVGPNGFAISGSAANLTPADRYLIEEATRQALLIVAAFPPKIYTAGAEHQIAREPYLIANADARSIRLLSLADHRERDLPIANYPAEAGCRSDLALNLDGQGNAVACERLATRWAPDDQPPTCQITRLTAQLISAPPLPLATVPR